MQRAYHRVEMEAREELKIGESESSRRRENSNCFSDIHYYLAHQVHPVVSRLCAPLEELDGARIAESLGERITVDDGLR